MPTLTREQIIQGLTASLSNSNALNPSALHAQITNANLLYRDFAAQSPAEAPRQFREAMSEISQRIAQTIMGDNVPYILRVGQVADQTLNANPVRAQMAAQSAASTAPAVEVVNQSPAQQFFQQHPDQVLGRGRDNREARIDIQNQLIRAGFLDATNARGQTNADGDFGPTTRRAIQRFQERAGLSITGDIRTEDLQKLTQAPTREQVVAQAPGANPLQDIINRLPQQDAALFNQIAAGSRDGRTINLHDHNTVSALGSLLHIENPSDARVEAAVRELGNRQGRGQTLTLSALGSYAVINAGTAGAPPQTPTTPHQQETSQRR